MNLDTEDIEKLKYAADLIKGDGEINSDICRGIIVSVVDKHMMTKPESDKRAFVRRLLDNAGTQQNVDAAHFYLKGYLACMDDNGL